MKSLPTPPNFPAWQSRQYQDILTNLALHIRPAEQGMWFGIDPSPQRQFYFFLHRFRTQYQRSENRPLLQRLAYALYTNKRMENALAELLHALVAPPEAIHSIPECLHQLPPAYWKLYRLQHKLGLSRWKRLRWGYEGIALWKSLDLHLQASFPYVAFSTSKTTFLRMSTPTRGPNGAPQLQEEFLAYLEAVQERKEHHLYINLQDRRCPREESHRSWRQIFKYLGFQEEAYRCACIESLGAKFPGVVSVITLDKDSLFYYQKGPYGGKTVSVDVFQQQLLSQMFDKQDSGFFWDPTLLAKGLQARCKKWMQDVEATYFAEKNFLSRKERRIYLEIFYSTLIQEVSRDFTYVNISCKDAIDRAGGALGFLYFFLLKEKNPDAKLEHWASVLFGPALIVKQRALFYSRFSRFYEATQYVMDASSHSL